MPTHNPKHKHNALKWKHSAPSRKGLLRELSQFSRSRPQHKRSLCTCCECRLAAWPPGRLAAWPHCNCRLPIRGKALCVQEVGDLHPAAQIHPLGIDVLQRQGPRPHLRARIFKLELGACVPVFRVQRFKGPGLTHQVTCSWAGSFQPGCTKAYRQQPATEAPQAWPPVNPRAACSS